MEVASCTLLSALRLGMHTLVVHTSALLLDKWLWATSPQRCFICTYTTVLSIARGCEQVFGAGPDAKKWEYVDLQGKEHGLFTSKQMAGWADRVFPPDLQVLPLHVLKMRRGAM